MPLGKGSSITEMDTSFRKSRMEGALAGVVKMVTVMKRWRKRVARWRRGMVWPWDMKGNMTKWGDAAVTIFLFFSPRSENGSDDI